MRKVLFVMEPNGLRDALLTEVQKDCEVMVCGTAAEGAALLQHGPDALVLDLFLPGTNGIVFLQRNRSKIPPTVIALTTFLSCTIAKTLSELGVSAVVMKPCTVDAVVNQLKLPI